MEWCEKQKRLISVILVFLLLLFTAGTVSACGEKDGSGYLFRYDLLSDPATLDPQTAKDPSSLMIIRNLYDGLLRIAEDGKLTECIASSYDIAADGLTYTFTLRQDAYWISKEIADKDESEPIPVTAHDFVFAFQRIFDPATQSPYNSQFFCLQNAQAVYSGAKNVSELGVHAENDYKLIFTLEEPNSNFLTLLTTAPAMPCNEAFFYDTRGKYGLETRTVLSNGAFYLREWQYDNGRNNYLILWRNGLRSAYDRVYPSKLNFFIAKPEDPAKETSQQTVIQDFKKEEIDCVFLQEKDAPAFLDNRKYSVQSWQSGIWGILCNTSSESWFHNEALRKGLSMGIDRTAYQEELEGKYPVARGYVPTGVTILNKSFRELVAEPAWPQGEVTAQNLWNEGLDEVNRRSLDSVKILMPLSFEDTDSIKFITQRWQTTLDFFCGLEIVSDTEYQRRLSSGEYQLALYHLEGTSNSPSAFLKKFLLPDVGEIGLNSLPDQKFSELMQQIETAPTLQNAVSLYGAAEKRLAQSNIYLPLFYTSEYFITQNGIEDLICDPFTETIHFAYGKNF